MSEVELRREFLNLLLKTSKKVGETILSLIYENEPRLIELKEILGDRTPKFFLSKTSSFLVDNELVTIDDFWNFVAERNSITQKKQNGEQFPWTEDKILQMAKINELDRKNDKGTKFLTDYIDNKSLSDQIYLIFLYRFIGSNVKLFEEMRNLDKNGVIEFLKQPKRVLFKSPLAYSTPSFPKGLGSGRHFITEILPKMIKSIENVILNHNGSLSVLNKEICNLYGQWDFNGNKYSKMKFHTGEAIKDLVYILDHLNPDSDIELGLGSKKGLFILFENNKSKLNFQTLLDDEKCEVNKEILENCLCEFRKYTEYKQGKKIKKPYVVSELHKE